MCVCMCECVSIKSYRNEEMNIKRKWEGGEINKKP